MYCSYRNTHPFNGPFSGTTQVSRYQKGKTNLDFTEAKDSEWHWHQLSHMQVCTSLQTDNHASTPPLCFYSPDALPAAQPTAPKHWRHIGSCLTYITLVNNPKHLHLFQALQKCELFWSISLCPSAYILCMYDWMNFLLLSRSQTLWTMICCSHTLNTWDHSGLRILVTSSSPTSGICAHILCRVDTKLDVESLVASEARYGDSVHYTVEENSSVFSLLPSLVIWMRWLPSVRACRQ